MAVICLAVACGGEPEKGDAGVNSLVRLDAEAAGAKCAAGGTAIRTGLDKNGNGVLDEDEVVATSWVCTGDTGATGAKALVRLVAEPAGDNCANGGTRVLSGVDLNANEELDEDEINDSLFVCDGLGASIGDVWEGDVQIRSFADLVLLQNVKEITGDVFVGDWMGAFALPRLKTVGGAFRFEYPDAPSSISLPALETAGAIDLRISNNSLTELDLSALKTVESYFFVGAANDLETLDLSALETVGGLLRIKKAKDLVTLDLSSLKTVGYFELVEANKLSTLDLSSLETSANGVDIDNNPVLTSIDLSALTAVAEGPVEMGQGTAMIDGTLRVDNNPLLTSLSLDALASVVKFSVTSNAVLTSLDVDALTEATERFYVNNNAALASISLEALTTAMSFEVSNHALLSELFAPALTSVSVAFNVRYNAKLASCAVDGIWALLDPAPISNDRSDNNTSAVCE